MIFKWSTCCNLNIWNFVNIKSWFDFSICTHCIEKLLNSDSLLRHYRLHRGLTLILEDVFNLLSWPLTMWLIINVWNSVLRQSFLKELKKKTNKTTILWNLIKWIWLFRNNEWLHFYFLKIVEKKDIVFIFQIIDSRDWKFPLLMKVLKRKRKKKKCWKFDEFFFELMLMLMSMLKLMLLFVISLFRVTLMSGLDPTLNEKTFASDPSMILKIKSKKMMTFRENDVDWLIKNLFIFFVNTCAEKNALIITLFTLKFSKFSMVFEIFGHFVDRIRTMRMIVVVLMIDLMALFSKVFCCWNERILSLIFIMTSFFYKWPKKQWKTTLLK